VKSWWPREHGAYAQLLAPVVTSLAAPSVAGGLLAIAACAAFLASEPLRVVIRKKRGAPRLALLVAIAAVAGCAGLVLAPGVLPIAACVVVPAAGAIVLAWRRVEHTLVGEIVAATALAGAAAPVAVAGGVPACVAAQLWAAWALGLACMVVAVHRVLSRRKRAASWRDHAIAGGLVAVTIATTQLPVAFPLAAMSAALAIAPPRANRLRAIGVALVVASVVAGALGLRVVLASAQN
jgi:hypothetical protein